MIKTLRLYKNSIGEGIHTILNTDETFKNFVNKYKNNLKYSEFLKIYNFRLKKINEKLPEIVKIKLNQKNFLYYNLKSTGLIKTKENIIYNLDKYEDIIKFRRYYEPKKSNINNLLINFDKQLLKYIT